MQFFGGKNFRWVGKNIKVLNKNGMHSVNLSRPDSIVTVPVKVKPNTSYEVTLVGCAAGGISSFVINFFANLNFDGPQMHVQFNKPTFETYTYVVDTPNFPASLPVNFRIFKTLGQNGIIFVHSIAIKEISSMNYDSEYKNICVNKDTNDIKLEQYQDYSTLANLKEENIKQKIAKVYKNNYTDYPKVSIITPTRDNVDLLKKCYNAINLNTVYPNFEWIVGDSDSKDGTPDYIKSLNDARIKLIERKTTEGSFSSINNDLVKFASGEYLLFLNDDTEPQLFWLFEMMSKICRDPTVGIVGARLLYYHDNIQHAGIAFVPQGPANIGQGVLGYFPKDYAEYDRLLQAVTGACMLMKAEDFKAVSGFDPIYFFCYEDVDLCLKIRKNLGKNVLYASSAIVIHSESITQKKFNTGGEKQQIGINAFKEKWMKDVEIDFPILQKDVSKGLYTIDISFITCVNSIEQYRSHVLGSLFRSSTKMKYEFIPVLNFNNSYSAAKALNLGINRAKGRILVLCHQDVIFFEEWADLLINRINEIEEHHTKNWGVLGTAGIDEREKYIGLVHKLNGSLDWESNTKARVCISQTVDEHCIIIRKNSGLYFDDKIFNGFHCYGPDICLNSISKGLTNFGILCPLVHNSSGSSLLSGRDEFMRLLKALADKWSPKFKRIRTSTSIINNGAIQTFIQFR